MSKPEVHDMYEELKKAKEDLARARGIKNDMAPLLHGGSLLDDLESFLVRGSRFLRRVERLKEKLHADGSEGQAERRGRSKNRARGGVSRHQR